MELDDDLLVFVDDRAGLKPLIERGEPLLDGEVVPMSPSRKLSTLGDRTGEVARNRRNRSTEPLARACAGTSPPP
jgi:hypothetical protein